MRCIVIVLAALVFAIGGAGAFVYSGGFNVAADVPHSTVVYRLLGGVRARSVSVHAAGIAVPELNDAKLIRAGAIHYKEMCTGCHLAPGMKDSELRAGLAPQPPDLTLRAGLSPAEMFWTIKHGIKMTGMPAWGKTHDDESIWGLVAIVQRLPDLGPEQYLELTDRHDDHHPRHAPGKHAHDHDDKAIH